jgi:thiol-disulfide isomerase/thioredoxin
MHSKRLLIAALITLSLLSCACERAQDTPAPTPKPSNTPSTPPASTSTTPSTAAATLTTLTTPTTQQTPTPNGEVDEASLPTLIDVTAPEALAAILAPGAQATVVNVWATWCSPCVEEFPYLVQLHRNYADKGLRVVLISFDCERQTKATRQFLQKNNVTFPTYRRAGKDQLFIEGLSPSWSGALPLTLIYDSAGKLRRAWEREATYEEFEDAVLKVLSPQ